MVERNSLIRKNDKKDENPPLNGGILSLFMVEFDMRD